MFITVFYSSAKVLKRVGLNLKIDLQAKYYFDVLEI